ncbi:carbohydrate ABC transporter permease [Paenibacillus ihbetae]|uniref:Sugar ABC transporter permease n=1 Tax=Paenibacillus ihbetae TaxID=1870820 RepID=A0A1B2E9P9_9BACL|nr:carbohydrate ABC transporter permease [Paenibacillus ihbetae]ANY76669.1 sugar ABC transporter permease [Paenibacillus ihbetae]OOC64331.1 sugar ABC transporter permease [Paenibacillus ihbetae]
MERESFGDKCFVIVNAVLLTLVLIAVLYPLWFVLIASISDTAAVLTGKVWLWPRDFTLAGYKIVLQNGELLRSYGNTVLYTAIGTAINLVLTVMAAYPMSRRDYRGRNALMAFIVFTMFFSGGMIPTYLLVKDLGMLNTIWALVIPNAVSVWNIIIMRTFFQQSLPYEIQEAAQIDGCSDIKILLRIVLPLSKPILAVMVLFYAVGHWNAFFNALIYLTDRDLYPLQLILREILIQGQMASMMESGDTTGMARRIMEAESIKYAVVIIANLPVLLLYPFLQKYFVKGVLVGSLKG